MAKKGKLPKPFIYGVLKRQGQALLPCCMLLVLKLDSYFVESGFILIQTFGLPRSALSTQTDSDPLPRASDRNFSLLYLPGIEPEMFCIQNICSPTGSWSFPKL